MNNITALNESLTKVLNQVVLLQQHLYQVKDAVEELTEQFDIVWSEYYSHQPVDDQSD